MDLRGKVLAIIGAGEGALPIITKAKEMGITTVAYGRNDSLTKGQMDFFIEENNFDIHFIAESCRELHANGVMPSSELSTEVAARVAHEAGLLGNEVEHGFGGKNKFFMRTKVAQLSSVKQPAFQLYHEGIEPVFPVVVKAVDACGKRGVSIAYNREDLETAVKQAQENSSDGSALVEEYLKGGQEYSIECLSYGKGKHQVIQYTDKESAGPPHFVEIAHHQPANLSDTMKERVDKAAWDILEVLGLNCGMAHLEIIIIDNEIYFIEVGARGGGDHISDILTPLSTGFDYYKAAIECHLGVYQPIPVTTKACSGIYFHSKQNERLKPLFDTAGTAEWCVKNTVVKEEFDEAIGNVGASNSGFIIYSADHRITLKDCPRLLNAEVINNGANTYQLVKNYCISINNYNPDTFDSWYNKINSIGNIIAITDSCIIAFLLLYCTQKEIKDGYICNVYVLNQYRGLGLSVRLLDKAAEVCKSFGFKSVSLHVSEDNEKAIRIYERYGFEKTGGIKSVDNDRQLEMRLFFA